MYKTLIFFTMLLNVPKASVSAESSPVTAELVTRESSIQPGRPFLIGVHLTMDEDYHTYWKNPGNSGLPTRIEWSLPAGFTAGDIHWPFPKRFVNESEVTFGYENNVILLTKITPPETLTQSRITLKADVSWLACSDICIPGRATLSKSMAVKHSKPAKNQTHFELFNRSLENLPKAAEHSRFSSSILGEHLFLEFDINEICNDKNVNPIDLFIEQEGVVQNSKNVQFKHQNDVFAVRLSISPYLEHVPALLSGILVYRCEISGKPEKRAVHFTTSPE